MFLDQVEAEGPGLIRCLALDGDPEGTEHVGVKWTEAFGPRSCRQSNKDWQFLLREFASSCLMEM